MTVTVTVTGTALERTCKPHAWVNHAHPERRV